MVRLEWKQACLLILKWLIEVESWPLQLWPLVTFYYASWTNSSLDFFFPDLLLNLMKYRIILQADEGKTYLVLTGHHSIKAYEEVLTYLHAFLTSTLARCEPSASCLGRCTHDWWADDTRWLRGWRSSKARGEVSEKRPTFITSRYLIQFLRLSISPATVSTELSRLSLWCKVQYFNL